MRTLLLFIFICNFTFSQTKKDKIEQDITPVEIKASDLDKVIVVKVSDTDAIDEAIPFAVVEQIPLFENCKSVEKKNQMNCFYEEMEKHVKKHLKYPKEAKKDKIEDRVITVFEIDKQGKVTNIHARGKKSNYKSLFEEEAKRIIQKLPLFSPGLQRGKAVIVKYSMPITFKL